MSEEIQVAQLNGNVNENVLVDGVNGVNLNDPQEGLVNGNGPSTSAPPTVLPTYDDIFPALASSPATPNGTSLPGQPGGFGISGLSTAGKARPTLKSSNVSKMYRLAPEERRHHRVTDQVLNRICNDIMRKTGTEITKMSSKDGTLSFLISGKDDAANQARRLIANEFQAQVTFSLNIPKEHHRIILGKAGKKLSELEQSTGTKIQIPKQDENSEAIRITGTKESIERAVHEINSISADASSRSVDRLVVPKIYHPFIFGPFNETLNAIMAETGAKVNIPPQMVMKDEITITGDRNAVKAAKDRVSAIYEDIEKNSQTVSIEVKKAQHKYIVGPKGSTLNEIFQSTGVSVEMPPPDTPSETIVLRGQPDKLSKALSVLFEKAHSETEEELVVPSWVQRHILGPKGAKFQALSRDFPKVNVNFDGEESLVKLSGPKEEVAKARQLLKQRADEIIAEISVEEIKVADSAHIKFIVGKNGANLKQIRDETKATIQVITDDDIGSRRGASSELGPQFIRIEGSKEAVSLAKAELEKLLNKLENEVTLELIIERRFYGQIIGSKGENIRDIRNKFNNVNVIFPETTGSSSKVIIRGNKKDADQCYKHFVQLNKELIANNHRIEVPIFSQLLQFLQRKDSIKKIREETGTRIDLPSHSSDSSASDSIVITGPKDKAELARQRIQELVSTLADISQVDIIVPHKIHNYMLGSKGRNIKSITAECGGVIINFPPEGSGSDKVQISGPRDNVQKAKQLLIAMSNDYQTNNYSEELKVKVQHHRYLIGKNGSSIAKLRDQTNVRLYFASDSVGGNSKDADPEKVIITGKKEEVQKVRAILENRVKELDNICEDEMRVDPKYHHLFVSRRAALCKQLFDEYGGVNISFPPLSDAQNDRITLKGSKECVQQVKQRIQEIIDDHQAQTTIDVVIDASHHRHLLARNGKVNTLQQEFDVKIKFPARPRLDQVNGDEEPVPVDPAIQEKANIVQISGRQENCEKARDALLALVPVTVQVDIPYEYHRFIIGQKGAEVRALMDAHNVNIRVPPPSNQSNLIVVVGSKDCVESATKALNEKLAKLNEEKADREARSFQVSFQVDPIYHPKIIGKRGAVISKIRNKFGVQIQVPEPGKVNGNAVGPGGDEADSQSPATNDLIIITGYEKNANEAKEEILKIVHEFKDMVTEELFIDSRVHPRIIGARGKNVRQIMDEHKVDIRFPRNSDANPDLVVITGSPDAVEAAKERINELCDEFMDDIEVQYQPPANFQISLGDLATVQPHKKDSPSKGFQVRGGPWERPGAGGQVDSDERVAPPPQNGNSRLDMSNAQEFPAFGVSGDESGLGGSAWGPKR